MVVDDLFRGVVHAAVTGLDGVAMEDLLEQGICVRVLVLIFLLNGGLYQNMLFRCLFFRLVGAFGS